MTVIAAYSDGENIAIGGDSGAFDENIAISTTTQKVWKAGEHLVGVSGSFRVMELVADSRLGNPRKVRDFLVAQSEKSGFPTAEWAVLITDETGVWEIGSDFSLVKSRHHYNAIGSGGLAALGAFSAVQQYDLSAARRINLALEAALTHTPYTRKPLKVISL